MIVRTVLGDICPSDLGICYAHEHIIIDRSYVTEKYPEFLLEDVNAVALELQAFHAAGGRAMVDSMPCGGGRNVLKLAKVSQISGVHILCPTGVHLPIYYPSGHWSERFDCDALTTIFIDEIRNGIDRNDTNGPNIELTRHRAGLIKVASGLDRLDERAQRIFSAAAAAHVSTGATILTHTEQGTAGIEQVRFLMDHGVSPSHIVISHLDRKPDVTYHREVLSTGVYLEYDSTFRWKGIENPTLDLLIALASDGFLAQLMLGMDAARFKYWRIFGGEPGLTFLLDSFSKMLLSMGWKQDHLKAIFVDNPARAYAFQDSIDEMGQRESEG